MLDILAVVRTRGSPLDAAALDDLDRGVIRVTRWCFLVALLTFPVVSSIVLAICAMQVRRLPLAELPPTFHIRRTLAVAALVGSALVLLLAVLTAPPTPWLAATQVALTGIGIAQVSGFAADWFTLVGTPGEVLLGRMTELCWWVVAVVTTCALAVSEPSPSWTDGWVWAGTYHFSTPLALVVAAIIGMTLGAVLSIAPYRRTRRSFRSLAASFAAS